ncbi:hypothetical protein PIB30_065142 [Stylosanthes scabra]|uniref:Transmembrane protein n=1 Tax=Stylosanthes scabra TaxID=79078 RepID=A0ABU6WPW7_9FABA|nr:hypothetical protein [Stylosanthes scabra]
MEFIDKDTVPNSRRLGGATSSGGDGLNGGEDDFVNSVMNDGEGNSAMTKLNGDGTFILVVLSPSTFSLVAMWFCTSTTATRKLLLPRALPQFPVSLLRSLSLSPFWFSLSPFFPATAATTLSFFAGAVVFLLPPFYFFLY